MKKYRDLRRSERAFMLLETQRLTIRDVKPEDEAPFVEMASDGSRILALIKIVADGWENG